MAARSSSPTSLLWAHQLKREHGYLLKRMQDSETANERQTKRIKTVEDVARSNRHPDISALAKEVKALEAAGINDRLSKMEHETKQKTEHLEAGSESIAAQVAAMQKSIETREEDKQRAFSREKALLKRIADVETGLNTYGLALGQMGKRINETQMEQIKLQLDALSKRVVREGDQMKLLAESVTALEAANEELRKANEKLKAELEQVASRPVIKASAVESDAAADVEEEADVSSAVDVAPEKVRKEKKLHKCSGEGADRDIVVNCGRPFGSCVISPPTKAHGAGTPEESGDEAPASKTVRQPLQWKSKPEPIPPHLRLAGAGESSGLKKKSHKWAGGGADRDVIRSGQGWLEVASSEHKSDGATTKTPGLAPAPKKRTATPRWTVEEAMTQRRTTRRQKQDAEVSKVEGESVLLKSKTKDVAKPAAESKVPGKQQRPSRPNTAPPRRSIPQDD